MQFKTAGRLLFLSIYFIAPIFAYLLGSMILSGERRIRKSEKLERVVIYNMPESDSTDQQIHFVVFFFLFEFVSGFIGNKTEKIISDGFITRVTHYTICNGGSRTFYVALLFIHDLLENSIKFLFLFYFTKLLIEDTITFSGNDVPAVIIYSVYDMARSILVSLIPTHMAQSFKHYRIAKFLLKRVVFFVYGLIAIKSVTLSMPKSSLSNYMTITAIGLNLYFQWMPKGGKEEGNKTWKAIGGKVEGDKTWIAWLLLWFIIYATILGFIVWWNWRIKQCLVRLTLEDKSVDYTTEDMVTANTEEIEIEEVLAADAEDASLVKVKKLKKVFDIGTVGCEGISFTVGEGEAFVLLGPAGCGKTSLLETMAGILQRTSGDVYYDNQPMNEYDNRHVSFALQKNALWEFMTFREHIRLFGLWKGLSELHIEQILLEIQTKLTICKYMDVKVKNLPAGAQKQLSLILSLFGAPKILILDEPTSGMDETSRRYFISLLEAYKKSSGAAIILTTSSFSEAQQIAQKVGIMINGRLKRVNNISDIVKPGFLIRLTAHSISQSEWSDLTEKILNHLTDITKVCVLWDNKTDHLSLHASPSEQLPTLHSVYSLIPEATISDKRIDLMVSRATLEFTYASYATAQVVRPTVPQTSIQG